MPYRNWAERAIQVRRQLYRILLLLGVVGLFQLLLTDMRMTLSAGTIPAVGEAGPRLKPLTQGASMDGFGAWSPDGSQIAFMRDGQILLTDPSGKKTRVLTSEPESWDATPAWRPDGKMIAFARLSMQEEPARLMLIDPAQGKPREVARETQNVGYLTWSPDGQSLYYTTNSQILRLDLGSGKVERLYAVPRDWELISGGLALSPDGKFLIYGAGPRQPEGVQYELWRLPTAGGQPQQLTDQGGIMPALNPTGTQVSYRNPRGQSGIYLLNLATGATERIVPDEPKALYFHPHFAPDGGRLVLSRLLLAPPPAKSRGGFVSNLYLYNLEGK